MIFDKTFLTNLQNQPYLIKILPTLQEERTRSFTTIVLTLFAVSIFGFFAINPTLSTIADLQKQISDNQFVDQQLQRKISNLTALQQKYATIQNDIPAVLQAIPVNADPVTFIAQIQAIAKESNIQITNIQTYPVDITTIISPNKRYTTFAFTIDAIGDPEHLNGFVSSVNSFNRLITIDNISFNQTLKESILLRLDIKGKAYFKNS